MSCTICGNVENYHTYSSDKTVCKNCFNFFQMTVNKMIGDQG